MQYAQLMPESLWDYLVRITNNAPGAEIARVVGMDAGSVSRWKTGKARPSMEAAVAIANNWNRSPVEVLIAAGHLDPSSAERVVEVGRGVDELTDEELLTEIRHRMKGARRGLESATQQDAPATSDEDKKIPRPPTPEELELAARTEDEPKEDDPDE